MAEPKTRPTRASVAAFLDAIPQSERRRHAQAVAAMMRDATGARATMWGPTIIGFGRQPITGATGRTTEWPVAAFAPRATGLVLYFDSDFLALHPLLGASGSTESAGAASAPGAVPRSGTAHRGVHSGSLAIESHDQPSSERGTA